jgi:hypothetical protein
MILGRLLAPNTGGAAPGHQIDTLGRRIAFSSMPTSGATLVTRWRRAMDTSERCGVSLTLGYTRRSRFDRRGPDATGIPSSLPATVSEGQSPSDRWAYLAGDNPDNPEDSACAAGSWSRILPFPEKGFGRAARSDSLWQSGLTESRISVRLPAKIARRRNRGHTCIGPADLSLMLARRSVQ